MKELKIKIPDDRLTNWTVITNRLYERRLETTPFVPWTGVLFCVTHKYRSFSTNEWRVGLERVELSNTSQVKVAEINASQFHDGDFLYIVVGEDESGAGPSKDLVQDAKQLWNETLSKHAEACTGGIILWKHPKNEIRIRLSNETDPNHEKYEFECDTNGILEIKHYKKTGELVNDLSDKSIEQLDFKSYDDPDPKDVIYPPRYP